MASTRPFGAQRAAVRASVVTEIGVAGYAFSLPFQRAFAFGVGSPATIFAAFAVLAGAAALVVGDLPRRFHPVHGVAAALVGLIVLNLGIGSMPRDTLHPVIRVMAGADARSAIQLLVMLGLMWQCSRSARSVVRLASAYVCGAHVAVLFSVAEWIRHGDGADGRITGNEITQPNVLAISLVIAVPLAWWVMNRSQARGQRLVMAGYLIAAPVGVLLTGSRTGLVVLLIAAASLLSTMGHVPIPTRAALLAVAATAVIFLPPLMPADAVDRSLSVLQESEQRDLDDDLRGTLFAEAWQTMAENPVFGEGRGAIRERYAELDGRSVFSSHNSFLNVGAEFGVPALGLYAAMWTLAGVATRHTPPFERRTALTVVAVTVLGSQLVNFDLEKANWFAVGIVIALAGVAPTPNRVIT